jgi:hypothetical protein
MWSGAEEHQDLDYGNADNVDFTPKEKSIQWLRTRTRPPHLPKCRRPPGGEFMTFKIKGVVRNYTVEDDHDFHVVHNESAES